MGLLVSGVSKKGEQAMSDKELLELAAKAAGMTIDTHYIDGGASVWEGERHHSDWIPDWNPLTDDGDALRLAVKLRMDVRLDDPNAATSGWTEYQDCAPTRDGRGPWYWKEFAPDGDPYAATRRAIVRAAAEIGRSMK
jgi:hypothetical protein